MENWKDIKGYEGLYEVSDMGRIKSFKRKGNYKTLFLKCSLNHKGYYRVGLSKNNKRNIFSVHRLVAQAFILNTENKPQINHINGIKDDNRVENLEWCTRSENIQHAYDNGLMNNTYFKKNKPEYNKGKFGILHYNSVKVNQYTLAGEFIKTWNSISDIRRELGICNVTRAIINNLTAGNFKWKYKN